MKTSHISHIPLFSLCVFFAVGFSFASFAVDAFLHFLSAI